MAQISLFGQGQKKEGLFTKVPPVMQPSGQLNEVVRRLRILEERFTNLQTKTQVTEQNMLSRNRSFSTEIKTIISDIHEIKREIDDIKTKILMIIKELQTCARKEDVKIIERYVNLWEPIRFVTQNDVDDIVNQKIDAILRNRRPK